MFPIKKLATAFSKRAREKRSLEFRNRFLIDENTKILDLGSETGSNINSVLKNTSFNPQNVYIADIDSSLVEKGSNKYGFVPVLISESEQLPFEDNFFDIVYCSSVIEHVTIPKEQVWTLSSGEKFKDISLERQKKFATEIQRLGKQYFVQTPYKHFIVESHSLIPFIAWLPRKLLMQVLKITNTFWVKRTKPDWHLLDHNEMSCLFQDAEVIFEKFFKLKKSMMAVKTSD